MIWPNWMKFKAINLKSMILNDKIRLKLGNSEPTFTEIGIGKVRSFSGMLVNYYRMKKSFAFKLEDLSACKISYAGAYKSVYDTLKSLEILLATGKQCRNRQVSSDEVLLAEINTERNKLVIQIELLRSSQAEMKTRLTKANELLNDYIKECNEWAESLIIYIKLLESGKEVPLEDQDKRILLGQNVETRSKGRS